jgi:hypothetical protein
VDDLLLLPLGIYVAIKLLPPEIMSDCRSRADALGGKLPRRWTAGLLILTLWLIALALVGFYLTGFFLPQS